MIRNVFPTEKDGWQYLLATVSTGCRTEHTEKVSEMPKSLRGLLSSTLTSPARYVLGLKQHHPLSRSFSTGPGQEISERSTHRPTADDDNVCGVWKNGICTMSV
jgi:hypothetical protein